MYVCVCVGYTQHGTRRVDSPIPTRKELLLLEEKKVGLVSTDYKNIYTVSNCDGGRLQTRERDPLKDLRQQQGKEGKVIIAPSVLLLLLLLTVITALLSI